MVIFCVIATCTNPAEPGKRFCMKHSAPRAVTEKQVRVLDFIRDYIAETRYPPTVDEIGQGLKIGSKNTVFQYLARLERLGYIEREFGKARSIRVIGG